MRNSKVLAFMPAHRSASRLQKSPGIPQNIVDNLERRCPVHHVVETPYSIPTNSRNIFTQSRLSSDRNALLRRWRTDTSGLRINSLAFLLDLICTRLPVQVAALLDRATALCSAIDARVHDVAVPTPTLVGTANARRGEVRDVLWKRVLGANASSIDRTGLAGLGESVVARVEVLAFLEVLREVVGLGGQLAVETEETLLVWGQRLQTLVSKHGEAGEAEGNDESKRAMGSRKDVVECLQQCRPCSSGGGSF